MGRQRDSNTPATLATSTVAVPIQGVRPARGARRGAVTVALLVGRNGPTSFGGLVPSLLSHLIHPLARRDIRVRVCTSQNLADLEPRSTSGVLAVAPDDPTLEGLRRLRGLPVVVLNGPAAPGFSTVTTDHRRTGETAFTHLIGRGHRRVAMICGAPDDHAAALRVAGFRAAAVRHGVGTDAATVAFAGHQPMYGLLRRVLAAGPTALFVADEALALEASHILRDLLDLRVPEHVSLLGMESAEMSRLLAMTALAQPLEELARAALDLLLRQAEARDPAAEHVVLPCRLIERDSVATATAPPPSRRPYSTEHVVVIS